MHYSEAAVERAMNIQEVRLRAHRQEAYMVAGRRDTRTLLPADAALEAPL